MGGSLERKAVQRGRTSAGKDGGDGSERQTATNRRAGAVGAETLPTRPAAARRTVTHKRSAGGVIVCNASLLESGDTTSDYWPNVTCEDCLALKHPEAAERTSIKHSHRAEGFNFVD